MQFISPNWPAPPSVRALSTTRIGGASAGPYASMNLADHVDDESSAVAKNRQILTTQAQLPSEPVWLNQVHGVQVIDASLARKATRQTADGSWSACADVVCAVLTADCLPLLLTNKSGTRVAAIHAGWRGLAAGIVEQGVGVFEDQADQLMAWAGPCIGPTAFEVGLEVKAQLGGPEAAYKSAQSPAKVLADLALLTQSRLADIGVIDFYQSELCTVSNPEHYFSYRRDGQCGRTASLIWIEGNSCSEPPG